jgi:hypothetical protein
MPKDELDIKTGTLSETDNFIIWTAESRMERRPTTWN